jgi:hypothetical protein
MKLLLLLSLALSFNVYAETATQDELTLADEAIDSPTLNIEGQYQVEEQAPAPKKQVVQVPKQRRLSSSEKLKLYRERLEERNRIMVEKKMEQIRFQQEMALARKLEASMNQTLKAIDTIE